MPTLSITLTAAQVARVQAAFGHDVVNADMTSTHVPATQQEIIDLFKKFLKDGTRNYEGQLTQATTTKAVDAETW